ncbi:MAG: 16S rRNA (adenine(1518)-N(6)/adenine(1519)-N(6))-dimethyltransferase RsmA, partial [Dehalococcoidales bacterium]
LRAKKGLGQHFLVDEGALRSILDAAQLTEEDTVIEVGPGLGVLTAELAGRAGRVVAVELDDRLADILKQSLASYQNVTIINRDILGVAPEALLSEAGLDSPSAGYKVVANLPYYITSPVLRHFLEAPVKPESMVVMVQKEVAAEITAGPGQMSLLSIGIQLYGEPSIIDYVPAGSFYPVPEVDSAILRVIPYGRQAIEIDDEAGFFALVRAGFSAARKQLANSLALGLDVPKEKAVKLLEKAGIEPRRRAEALSLEEWARLYRIYRGEEEPKW